MTIERIAMLGCLIVALSNGSSRSAEPVARPNILFIYTDDQAFRTLGCYRDEGAWPWVDTPNIDRLAREGIRFSCAYGASWCMPSRACVLTGLLPHGVRGLTATGLTKSSYDPEVCRFWPDELRKAGYETAMVGKWHVGHDTGRGRDWDHSVVWDQADIQGDWYNGQPLSIDGVGKQKFPGYSTDVYTQFASEFIRRDHKQPWLLWLCYNAPHLPNTVNPRHTTRYSAAEVPVPKDVFGPRPGKPKYMQEFTQWKRGSGADEGVPLYEGKPLPRVVIENNQLICAVDEGVGQILDVLEATGQLDQTVIIYTSDQGYAWGEHGFVSKVGPYDACLRMPLLVRQPQTVARPAVCRQPVTVVDLAPTILGLAGVPLPWEMHGRDLGPLLRNPQAEWDDAVLMEHFRWSFGPETDGGVTGKATLDRVPWWIFLRWGKYKYIRTLVPDEIEEVYDLEADPGEFENLALDATRRGLLDELRERQLAELKRTKAGLVANLPAPWVDP